MQLTLQRKQIPYLIVERIQKSRKIISKEKFRHIKMQRVKNNPRTIKNAKGEVCVVTSILKARH